MKKLLLLLIILISFTTYSQTENENITSKLVCKTVDEFTDKTSFGTTETVLLYEDGGDMKTQGMIFILFFRSYKEVGKL